jgi:hypothetical protein
MFTFSLYEVYNELKGNADIFSRCYTRNAKNRFLSEKQTTSVIEVNG